MRRSAATVAAVVIAAALGGCAQPSPVPQEDPGPATTVVRDGVAVTLSLERGQLPAGDRTWALVIVENRSPVDVIYRGGGCDFLADLGIEVAVPVAAAAGLEWEGAAGDFKRLAGGPPEAARLGAFLEASFVDDQAVACTSDLGVNELAAGQRLEMRAAWNGEISGTVAPPGAATVTARFPYLGRPQHGADPFARDVAPIVARVVVTVVDTGIRVISPNEAIDAALGDARFAAWLNAEPMPRWQGVGVEVKDGNYVVTLSRLIDGVPVDGQVTVDRATGRVLGFEQVRR
jgi:hypothetical protein